TGRATNNSAIAAAAHGMERPRCAFIPTSSRQPGVISGNLRDLGAREAASRRSSRAGIRSPPSSQRLPWRGRGAAGARRRPGAWPRPPRGPIRRPQEGNTRAAENEENAMSHDHAGVELREVPSPQAGSAGPRIVVDRVTKVFRGAAGPALQDCGVEVRPNEVLCVIGPSGCGKTTLLRIIDGLTRPDSGRVLFDGKEIT